MSKRMKMAAWLNRLTLKKRIVLLFAASALIPFVSTVLLSYNAMSQILLGKLESGVRSNLTQVQLSLENAYNNLNTVAQQLSIPSNIGYKLQQYTFSEDAHEKSRLAEEIRTELSLLAFTNATIGLAMYYYRDEERFIFENTSVKDGFSLDNLPRNVSNRYRIVDYAPHISNERYNNEYVISALQKIDIPGRDDVYVYVESGYVLTRNLLQNGVEPQSFYVLLDGDGYVAYSEAEDVFHSGDLFPDHSASGQAGLLNDYYWYKTTSSQGWSLVSLIPKADYNYERDRWVNRIVLLFLFFIVVTFLIAWLLWKMIYKPLRQFNNEIRGMSSGQFQPGSDSAHIPEFDTLLTQFRRMKTQIADLFAEVETKEKKRADLEIEKLLYQINPHFLMNTLDTVHWLAVMNGQNDIDRLVSSLNKLLYYNLGKLGQESTIREELESLEQYLLLQQIRYNFKFDLQIRADAEVLHVVVPRFILQPLVENALYHGLNDKGSIWVRVSLEGTEVVISVADNGSGISEEEIAKLLMDEQQDRRKVGMGIGMNYVKRMIESYFGGRARLDIESEPGFGTTVYLTLPYRQKEEESS